MERKKAGFICRFCVLAVFSILVNAVTSFSWEVNTDPELGEAGKAAPYLKTGVGARVLSLGNAFVGLADDGTAAFWNPAGLARLEEGKRELNFMYTKMSLDRVYNFVSFVFPASLFTAGLSVINSGITDNQGYDSTDRLTGKFDYTANAFILSCSKQLNEDISAGVNLKGMQETLIDNTGSGYSLDLGLLATLTDKISMGIVIDDILGKIDWKTSHADTIDMAGKLGIAYKLAQDKLTLVADAEKYASMDALKLHVGSELKVSDIAAFRLGMNENSLTAGFGTAVSLGSAVLGLDYGFCADNLKVDDTHRVSAKIVF